MNFCPQHIGDPWFIWGASPSCAPPILWSFCNWHAVMHFVSPTWPLMYFQLNTKILTAGSQDHLISLGYLSSCCIIALISLKKSSSNSCAKNHWQKCKQVTIDRRAQIRPVSEWPIAVSTIPQNPQLSTYKSLFSFCCVNMTLLNRYILSIWSSSFPLLD